MGDDTWCRLFPNTFDVEYPFESFKVNDLDSVDFGIMEHIYDSIKGKDWKLLIGKYQKK
jgi:phosphatidylinositol glycan class O